MDCFLIPLPEMFQEKMIQKNIYYLYPQKIQRFWKVYLDQNKPEYFNDNQKQILLF